MPTKDERQIDEACKNIMDRGAKNLIVPLGSKGCILWNKDGKKEYSSYITDNAIDYTGYVDCFIGVFAAFLSKNYELDEAIKYANLAASISVTIVGTISSYPKLEDINIKINSSLQVRIGINSGGPLIGGVLGTDKPVFDIIGDPINVASRLQSTDIVGKIQISQSTYELINAGDYPIEEREVFLKGKGKSIAYLLSQPTSYNFMVPSEHSIKIDDSSHEFDIKKSQSKIDDINPNSLKLVESPPKSENEFWPSWNTPLSI